MQYTEEQIKGMSEGSLINCHSSPREIMEYAVKINSLELYNSCQLYSRGGLNWAEAMQLSSVNQAIKISRLEAQLLKLVMNNTNTP